MRSYSCEEIWRDEIGNYEIAIVNEVEITKYIIISEWWLWNEINAEYFEVLVHD